jgi:hypothetical protein
MKNVFARTVLAIVLIPSFWMTSAAAGSIFSGWVDTPGETVGKMADCLSKTHFPDCSNPIRVSFTVKGFFQACLGAGWTFNNHVPASDTTTPFKIRKHVNVRYMQFVPDYSATNTALSGLCYYYEAGSSSGESGPHTWRWDE